MQPGIASVPVRCWQMSPGWQFASESQSPSHKPRGKFSAGLPLSPFNHAVFNVARTAQKSTSAAASPGQPGTASVPDLWIEVECE